MTAPAYPSVRDEHLEAIHHAVRTLERSRAHARRTVREALAAGVPHRQIAEELRNARRLEPTTNPIREALTT